jgi:beta-galactosidase
LLNGKQVKIKGVYNHHDLGPLGAAVNVRAMERQLNLLKQMGCNAIRSSHNPPDPQLLDLCDKLGFLVMDEAFDEWRIRKCKNGYHLLFDQWADKDLRAMIERDRNHPCVILWSIATKFQNKEIPAERKPLNF